MSRARWHEGGGFAAIYVPDGQLMNEPLAENVEGLVYARLDLGMISLAKAAADPAGRYARPDVTRLLHDHRRATAWSRARHRPGKCRAGARPGLGLARRCSRAGQERSLA